MTDEHSSQSSADSADNLALSTTQSGLLSFQNKHSCVYKELAYDLDMKQPSMESSGSGLSIWTRSSSPALILKATQPKILLN